MNIAKDNGLTGEFDQLCKEKLVVAEFLKRLDTVGKTEGLNSLERVKQIHLEHEPFLNRGICTTTMKVIRFDAKNYYADVITKLYEL